MLHPLYGDGVLINQHRLYLIQALPPYAVGTPHIHAGTAYGALNSSGGLMVMIMLMMMMTMVMMMMMMMMMMMLMMMMT